MTENVLHNWFKATVVVMLSAVILFLYSIHAAQEEVLSELKSISNGVEVEIVDDVNGPPGLPELPALF